MTNKEDNFSFLSLDISGDTIGWSSWHGDNLIKYGKKVLNKKSDWGKKLLELSLFLKKIFIKFNPCVVVLEDIYLGRNVKTLILLARLQGIVFLEFEIFNPGALIELVSPATWKSAVGINIHKTPYRGSSPPQKKMFIISEINKRFNLNFIKEDEDICDSIAIGLWFINKLNRG